MNAHLFRTCLGCVSFCLLSISNSSASVDICEEPTAESHLSIAYYKNEETSLEANLGELNRADYEFDSLFRLNNNWLFGGGLRSHILDVDQLDLQTNGYLHTFFLTVHRLSESDKGGFRFSFAPVLSASSNVTSDPAEYTSDALQLLVAFVWDKQISDRMGLRYGICGDHRLGEYQVYPVIALKWQPHPDWMFEIGFPTSQLSYQITEDLTSVLRIAPNGNEWYVEDKNLENHSQVVYEVYVLEWAFNWRANEHFMLTANVGREFHSQYKLTLLDENRVRLAIDPTTRIGVALAWYF